MEVILTPGPWQSLIAGATLRQLDVPAGEVGVVTMLPASEAALAKGCKSIHDCCGHEMLGLLNMEQFGDAGFADKNAALLKRIRTARRIWCTGLSSSGGPRRLFQIVRPAKIGIFEDGLHSSISHFAYGEEWGHYHESPLSLLKYYLRQLLHSRRLQITWPLFRRIDTIAILADSLYDRAALPPSHLLKIEESILRDLLGEAWVPEVFFEPAKRPRALILGGNFSKVESISPAQEHKSVEMAIRLLEPEYEVWWKAHPRADARHTASLVHQFPNLQIFPQEHQWVPVEAIVKKAGFSFIASPMSSSLLYCGQLWGIETMLTPRFEEHVKNFRYEGFRRIYQQLKKKIPQMAFSADD